MDSFDFDNEDPISPFADAILEIFCGGLPVRGEIPSDMEDTVSQLLFFLGKDEGDLHAVLEKRVKLAQAPSSDFSMDHFFTTVRSFLLEKLSTQETEDILADMALLLEYENSLNLMPGSENEFLQELVDPNTDVRSRAIRELIQSELPDKLQRLEGLSDSEQDIQLKFEILNGINRIKHGDESQLFSLTDKEKSSIENALNYKELSLSPAFLDFLRNFQILDALDGLKSFHDEYSSSDYKKTLVYLMSLTPKARAEDLFQFLDYDDQELVFEALQGFDRIGDQASLVTILAHTSHPDLQIQYKAREIMGNMGIHRLVSVLRIMSESEIDRERLTAADLLSNLRTYRGLRILYELTADVEDAVSRRAVEGLKSLRIAGVEQAAYVLRCLDTDATPKFDDHESQDHSFQSREDSRSILQNLFLPMDYHRQIEGITMAIAEDKLEEAGKDLKSLVEQLIEEDNPKILATGIIALKRIPGIGQAKLQALSSCISHDDARIRANSIEVLQGNLQRDQDLLLIESSRDENNRVAGNAIVGLSYLQENHTDANYQAAIEASLERLSDSTDLNPQLTTLYCLGILSDIRHLDLVINLTHSPFKIVRQRANELLASWALQHGQAREQFLSSRKKRLEEFENLSGLEI